MEALTQRNKQTNKQTNKQKHNPGCSGCSMLQNQSEALHCQQTREQATKQARMQARKNANWQTSKPTKQPQSKLRLTKQTTQANKGNDNRT